MSRNGNRWVMVGLAAGLSATAGCQSAKTTSSADTPVRSDVTDIRPTGRPAATGATAGPAGPALYDMSGLYPVVPQAVTSSDAEPVATAASFKAVPAMATETPTMRAASTTGKAGKATGKGRTHVVRRGETWFAIARAQYGDGAQWHRLTAANPAAAAGGPLRAGQTLVVP